MTDPSLGNLLKLALMAIACGAVCALIRYFVKKPFVSASMTFFGAWTLLFLASAYCQFMEWASILTGFEVYAQYMMWGALAGFSFAAVLPERKKSKRSLRKFWNEVELILDVSAAKFKWALFGLGCAMLAERLLRVGLSATVLSDLREVYNQTKAEGEYNPFVQLGSHLGNLVNVIAMLYGARDARKKLNVKALATLMLAAAPYGLAFGARSFLLAFTLSYLFSFILLRVSVFRRPYAFRREELRSVSVFIAFSVCVFSLLGYTRGGYGESFNPLKPILLWGVSTVEEMDTWVGAAERYNTPPGKMTFIWPYQIATRIGLIDSTAADGELNDLFEEFASRHDSAQHVPRSILPDLIFDYGPGVGIFVAMACFAFIFEFGANYFFARGPIGHVAAVICIWSAFMTIQTPMLFAASSIACVFWVSCLRYAVMNFSKRSQ